MDLLEGVFYHKLIHPGPRRKSSILDPEFDLVSNSKETRINRWPLRRPYLVDITVFNSPFQGSECFIVCRR